MQLYRESGNPMARGVSSFGRLTKINNSGLVVTVVLMVVGMTIAFPYFLTPINIETMAMGFIQEAIMALGMTIVIISGGIDLSVSAVLPFTAIIIGLLFNRQVATPLAIVLSLVLATLIGVVNGVMINRLRAHPFIVTLATLTAVKGVSLVITEGGTISGFPQEFYFIGQGRVLGIPFPVLLFVVLAVLFSHLLRNHKFFQQVYFVGGNQRAARLSGINVEGLRLVIYAINSFLAGLAGIITASQYVSANTGFGLGSELRVITTVIIGGASLSGGKGSIGGTIWGIIFLAIIANAFVLSGAPTYWSDVVYGGMLLIAVLLEEYMRADRKALRRRNWRDFLTSG
ncbi:MAG TPA: ABC transporter permease [Firmicutes bacterium]|nr:ABC transporter permease [Bacillota bacterium]